MVMNVSRRGWILGAGLIAAAEIAAAQKHAHEAAHSPSSKFEVLDAAAVADIDALTTEIIPSSDGPGAREAGAIYFIDRALAGFESDKREAYRAGLKEINAARLKVYPSSTSIAGLSSAQRIEVIRAIEKSDFFELLRTHTVWGFVGSPAYGGNRDKVGWTHIGFDDRMSFEAPFGFYDAHIEGSGKP